MHQFAIDMKLRVIQIFWHYASIAFTIYLVRTIDWMSSLKKIRQTKDVRPVSAHLCW